MRAVAVAPGEREVRLVNHDMPRISGDHQVKVKSLEVGICGTDREICAFVYGQPPQGYDYLVLGHEGLGEVVEVGANVKNIKVGQLVVPSVRRPCTDPNCESCRAGLQDFCKSGGFKERGINQIHGFLTEFYVDDERYFNVVPDHLRDTGVLVEPLTVAEKGLAQVWKVQERLPWVKPNAPAHAPGTGLKAVVLGAGPVGILGAMALLRRGFETYVYSRSKKPNPKADVVERIGAKYISASTTTPQQLVDQVGNIDLVYEAVGKSRISYEVLNVLGLNGIFVFTGIPAPHPATPVEADNIMRNLVLKNQVAIGTVNAAPRAFHDAIDDLAEFNKRWPDEVRSLITGHFSMENYRQLLVDEEKSGIKNVVQIA